MLWFQTKFGGIFSLSEVDALPTTVLGSMPIMRSIRRIGITINIIAPANEKVLIQDFSKLDALLATPQYTSLQAVYIFLYFIGPTLSTQAEVDAIPSVQMKNLSRNPSLHLVFQARKIRQWATADSDAVFGAL
jgi:hypothetical protein